MAFSTRSLPARWTPSSCPAITTTGSSRSATARSLRKTCSENSAPCAGFVDLRWRSSLTNAIKEMVGYLKTEHSLGHEYANQVA